MSLPTQPIWWGEDVLDTRDVLDLMHGRGRMTINRKPSRPYNAGTEHARFSPTRQPLLAPSAKRREVSGESHEGCAASYYEPLVRRACIWITASMS